MLRHLYTNGSSVMLITQATICTQNGCVDPIIVVVEGTATTRQRAIDGPDAGAREIARGLGAVMYATATTAGEFFRTLEESGLTLTQCKVLTALVPGAQGE